MALQRNLNILSKGIERIDVRNLLPPPGIDIDRFNPSIEVLAVTRDGDGNITDKYTVFKGDQQGISCNPSWNLTSGFDSGCFGGESKVTDFLIRFSCTMASENKNTSNNVDEDEHEETVFYEVLIEISKLFRLEDFSMTTLKSIPRNTIFFWVDDKALLMENNVYIALRKSKQINARNGSVAMVEGNLIGNITDGPIPHDSILHEMNMALDDEDVRNTTLKQEINESNSRVMALRTKAESIVEDTNSKASTTNSTIAQLEIAKLQALVEKAEGDLAAEESLLSADQASLDLAKERLDMLLKEWKEITTEKCCAQTTEKLIEEKKNDLTHTKFLLDARRLKLFGELSTIYPIEKVIKDVNDRPSVGSLIRSSSASQLQSQISDEEETYAIRGIELPMVIDGSLRDDEQISTALGYIVHVLLLTSKYLQISLRYEVIYNSSRSSIRDSVLGRGSTLPLYKRGVDKERFDRGLIWLQKNLEQLMDRMGYKYSRRCSMLYNLKSLFECEICPKLVS